MRVEENYIDADLDSPRDEVERKISRLENDIARVSNMEDRKVLWGVFGLLIFFVAAWLFGFNPTLIIIVGVTGIFGGLAYVLYENIRKKRDILISHGLKCPVCGYIPRTINASGVVCSPQCLKCGADLGIEVAVNAAM
jgi:hypothetical protein